ncbi:HAD family acid phosphatase [Streptomyces sp. NPDC029674]|uniref:phosphatase domain-containing protein n=1 Tax=Streptomyces sp. NPDC029674 TaxID=3365297 RepID=UPI00384BF9B0
MTKDKRPLAVFDLDGTLADTGHRQRYLERKPRDWDAFFAAAPQDPPLAPGVELALASARDCEVVYLTGRPERCRADTEEWLARHGLPAGRIWMRRNNDRRPARHTKLQVLHDIARTREIRVLVDDDDLVCEAAEQAGYPVHRVTWATTPPPLKEAQERDGRT